MLTMIGSMLTALLVGSLVVITTVVCSQNPLQMGEVVAGYRNSINKTES